MAGYKDFTVGAILTAAEVDGYLMEQTVMRFADSSARDTALSTVKTAGMVSVTLNNNRMHKYDGTDWINISDVMPACSVTRTAQSIPNTTVTTVAFGTSETEVQDSDGFKGAADDFITIPTGQGGDYIVDVGGLWSANATGQRTIYATIVTSVSGETDTLGSSGATLSGAVGCPLSASKMVRLDAGATVTANAWQSSGGALNVVPYLSVRMIRHVPSLT